MLLTVHPKKKINIQLNLSIFISDHNTIIIWRGGKNRLKFSTKLTANFNGIFFPLPETQQNSYNTPQTIFPRH
jgi:hypothetical protein